MHQLKKNVTPGAPVMAWYAEVAQPHMKPGSPHFQRLEALGWSQGQGQAPKIEAIWMLGAEDGLNFMFDHENQSSTHFLTENLGFFLVKHWRFEDDLSSKHMQNVERGEILAYSTERG